MPDSTNSMDFSPLSSCKDKLNVPYSSASSPYGCVEYSTDKTFPSIHESNTSKSSKFDKIGRAPCRERVESTVGCRAQKKKRKQVQSRAEAAQAREDKTRDGK